VVEGDLYTCVLLAQMLILVLVSQILCENVVPVTLLAGPRLLSVGLLCKFGTGVNLGIQNRCLKGYCVRDQF
jgi:hypothetical protein